MKQNIEAAISMRPIALPASKHLATILISLFANLANRSRAHRSEWSTEQSGLHERDQSAFRRQLLEAKLRETCPRMR